MYESLAGERDKGRLKKENDAFEVRNIGPGPVRNDIIILLQSNARIQDGFNLLAIDL